MYCSSSYSTVILSFPLFPMPLFYLSSASIFTPIAPLLSILSLNLHTHSPSFILTIRPLYPTPPAPSHTKSPPRFSLTFPSLQPFTRNIYQFHGVLGATRTYRLTELKTLNNPISNLGRHF